MAFITADRVKDTSTTTGTGSITVSGAAPTGYRTFSAVLSAGDTFYYCIQGQTTAEFEVGVGTYTSTNVFARTTVLASSNSNSAVSFSAGTKNVFITLAATKTLQISPSAPPTAGSVPYGTGSTLAYSAAGTAGQVLTSGGSGSPTWSTPTATAPGGSNTQVQYNNSGSFAGAANLTFDGTMLTANSSTVSTGNMNFSGTAQRITGDFSNATFANRLAFQNNTLNGNTTVYFLPNGTATISAVQAFGTSDPTNGSYIRIYASSVVNRLDSGRNGAGTYLPMGFNVGGISDAMYLNTSGNLGLGTTSPSYKLDIQFSQDSANGVRIANSTSGSSATSFFQLSTGTGNSYILYNLLDNAGVPYLSVAGGSAVATMYTDFTTQVWRNTGGSTEYMRVNSSGNVGIGTSSPNASAILDAQSTTKGVRFPNMTTIQKNAISSPAAGLVVFDTTLAKLCVYSGSAWQTITSV
jgi:hypothetical protein